MCVGWDVNVWHVVFATGEWLLVKRNSLSTPSPHTHAQTFLSIKGIYYQAEIEGQTVTWIVPHHFKQTVKSSDIMIWLLNARARARTCTHMYTHLHVHTHTPQIPSSVDLRVMLTFIEFYASLLGFINFKLYSSMNLKYPPQVRGVSLL